MFVLRNSCTLSLLTALGRSRAWELKSDYYAFLARLQADDLFAVCFMERYLDFILQQEERNLSQAVFYYLKKESVRGDIAKLLAVLSVKTKETGDRHRLGYEPKLEKEIDQFISLRSECEGDLEAELKRVQTEIEKLESVKEDARASFRAMWSSLDRYVESITPPQTQKESWTDEFYNLKTDERDKYDDNDKLYLAKRAKDWTQEKKRGYFAGRAGQQLVDALRRSNMKRSCDELLEQIEEFLRRFRAGKAPQGGFKQFLANRKKNTGQSR